jgi:pimeloyl-ACP methyl ester carboxylesterase
MPRLISGAFAAASLGLLISGSADAAKPFPSPSAPAPVFYRSVKVDGLDIFYREAGAANAPTLLLLHGFPSSSRMFEPLLARLSGQFHLLAPDYPGFGHSDAPDPKAFAYTFDHIAEVMQHFTEAVGSSRYVLYMQDYGGPVGFRLAVSHPERVQGIIIQNAVAHDDGLGPRWNRMREFWADRAANEAGFRQSLTSLAGAQRRHLGASPNVANYDPDLWSDEFAFVNKSGESDIQIDLFFDYRTNVASYSAWQTWLRQAKPPTLVVWGRYDQSFEAAEAQAYKREIPDAEVHLIDAGHFALDEKPDEVAALIGAFMSKLSKSKRPQSTPMKSAHTPR